MPENQLCIGPKNDCLALADEFVADAAPANRSAEGRRQYQNEHKRRPEPEQCNIGDCRNFQSGPVLREQFTRHTLPEYRPCELRDKKQNRHRGKNTNVMILRDSCVNRQGSSSPKPKDRIDAAEQTK